MPGRLHINHLALIMGREKQMLSVMTKRRGCLRTGLPLCPAFLLVIVACVAEFTNALGASYGAIRGANTGGTTVGATTAAADRGALSGLQVNTFLLVHGDVLLGSQLLFERPATEASGDTGQGGAGGDGGGAARREAVQADPWAPQATLTVLMSCQGIGMGQVRETFVPTLALLDSSRPEADWGGGRRAPLAPGQDASGPGASQTVASEAKVGPTSGTSTLAANATVAGAAASAGAAYADDDVTPAVARVPYALPVDLPVPGTADTGGGANGAPVCSVGRAGVGVGSGGGASPSAAKTETSAGSAVRLPAAVQLPQGRRERRGEGRRVSDAPPEDSIGQDPARQQTLPPYKLTVVLELSIPGGGTATFVSTSDSSGGLAVELILDASTLGLAVVHQPPLPPPQPTSPSLSLDLIDWPAAALPVASSPDFNPSDISAVKRGAAVAAAHATARGEDAAEAAGGVSARSLNAPSAPVQRRQREEAAFIQHCVAAACHDLAFRAQHHDGAATAAATCAANPPTVTALVGAAFGGGGGGSGADRALGGGLPSWMVGGVGALTLQDRCPALRVLVLSARPSRVMGPALAARRGPGEPSSLARTATAAAAAAGTAPTGRSYPDAGHRPGEHSCSASSGDAPAWVHHQDPDGPPAQLTAVSHLVLKLLGPVAADPVALLGCGCAAGVVLATLVQAVLHRLLRGHRTAPTGAADGAYGRADDVRQVYDAFGEEGEAGLGGGGGGVLQRAKSGLEQLMRTPMRRPGGGGGGSGRRGRAALYGSSIPEEEEDGTGLYGSMCGTGVGGGGAAAAPAMMEGSGEVHGGGGGGGTTQPRWRVGGAALGDWDESPRPKDGGGGGSGDAGMTTGGTIASTLAKLSPGVLKLLATGRAAGGSWGRDEGGRLRRYSARTTRILNSILASSGSGALEEPIAETAPRAAAATAGVVAPGAVGVVAEGTAGAETAFLPAAGRRVGL